MKRKGNKEDEKLYKCFTDNIVLGSNISKFKDYKII